MRLTISLFILFSTFVASAQEVNIIPQPISIELKDGKFNLNKNTVILYNSFESWADMNAIAFFNNHLLKYYGFKLKARVANDVEKGNPWLQNNCIIFLRSIIEQGDTTRDESSYYNLRISNKNIAIIGRPAGNFYAIISLIQMLPEKADYLKNKKIEIKAANIDDVARFKYRGLHLDVGRHFMPVDYIKKYIDYIALHKMNYFHWHLTEDQGWRIEIKKYPKLTSVGGWRNGSIIGRYPGTGNDGIKYGGFYTQEQIKEIVKYAADRYITVVPEIEMPGHSSAAIAAYPELSCFPNEPTINYFPKQCVWSGDSSGKQVQQTWGVFDDVFCAGQENTFKFLEDVMDEVLALFPSKYIHVGGDECPKENWKRCTHCQQRMKDNKLKDEHELQSYFIQRMEKYLNKKGRTLIGWDEILEGGLAPNAVVMSWRGEQGGIDAAKQKHNVIMTPGNPVYFDHSQSENEDSVTIGGYNSIEKVYAYEPIPKELNAEEAKYVLGAQANLWTEYIKNPVKLEYMLLPRLAALSEALWSPKEKMNWGDFEKRLQIQFKRYDLWKANYSRAYFDLKVNVQPMKKASGQGDGGIYWVLNSKIKDADIYVKSNDTLLKRKKITERLPLKTELIDKPFSTTLIATLEKNGKIISSLNQFFNFNKATGKKITLTNEASKNYPGDGAFTLVNGVQNEKGLARSKEFLGFSGTDCEAIIDLGKTTTVNNVVMHSLHLKGSWIWRPQTLEVFSSADGINFSVLGLTDDFLNITKSGNGSMTVSFKPIETKFIKVKVTNWGEIPTGEAGAGNKAWLFVDEIEIN